MIKLINSIFGNYYILPIVFNVTEVVIDGVSKYRRTTVDGKQRLSSVREFVKGNIPCTDRDGLK